MAIDFTMLRQSPLEGVLDPVVDAITRSSQRRHQREQQEERLRFGREQEERLRARDQGIINKNNAAADLNERRLVGDRTAKNLGSRQAVEEKIRAALANGDYDLAEQLGNSYTEADAKTGDVHQGPGALPGFKVERPPAAPPAMPALPPGVEYGPQATSGIANRAGKIRAEERKREDPWSDTEFADASAAQDERKRFNQQQDAQPADPLIAEFQSKLDASKAPPRVTIGGVQADPEQLRHAAGRAQAQDFSQLGSVLQASLARAVEAGDPQAQAAAQRKLELFAELAPAVSTGQVQGKDAANRIFGATTAEFRRGADLEQTTLKGNQAQGRAETMATAATARAAEAGKRAGVAAERGEKSLDLKERAERSKNTKQDLTSFFQRWNAKTTQDAATTFPKIVEKLNSGNGKLQQDALIQMMRISQADNRFSDADAKMALTVGANWASQLESALSRGIEGDIGDDVLAIATKAAQALHQHYQEKTAAMNEEADSFLDDDALYDTKRAASVLGRELPTFRQRHPDLFGKKAPAAPTARPPGRATAPAAPGAVDDPNNDGPFPGEDDTSTPEGRVRARAKALGADPDAAVRNLRAAGKL